MTDPSRPHGHQGHKHGTDQHHEHNPHHWESADYVARWADGQDQKEADRAQAFQVIAETIPHGKMQAISILDLGAGYGALTKFLLEHNPTATAVCLDGSEQMAKLGRQRMEHLAGRFDYLIANFSRPGWSKLVPGPFSAVVSAIAIHNVNSSRIIRGIYEDVYTLVQPGGCFLNFDRHDPPIEEQMTWLRAAGFDNVRCFWQDNRRGLFGGFRN